MRQTKYFADQVYKGDGSNLLIGAGDSVALVLKDESVTTETITETTQQSREIHWDHRPNGTRSQDVRGVTSAHKPTCPDGQQDGEYYLDADGNPILDSNGNPIPLPT